MLLNKHTSKILYNIIISYDNYKLSACAHCIEGQCRDGGCEICKAGYILNDDGTCHACPNVDDSEVTCSQCSSKTRARFFSANTCLCEY